MFLSENGLWNYRDIFSGKSLLEDHASAQMSANLRGGWSVGLSPRLSSYSFNAADYAQYVGFTPSDRIESLVSGLSFGTPYFRRWDASVSTTAGTDVDFLETARVRRQDYNAAVNLRPTDRLRIAATYVSSAFYRRLDGERSVSTRIPRLKVEYQLARPIFVRVVSQYTATRREALRDPVTGQILQLANGGSLTASAPSASNTLRTDWLFSYRPTPGTVLFVGYGGSMTEADPLAFSQLRRTSDAFFVKGSYVFRLSGERRASSAER
jgi:hypothetical protein